jgi:hypothetical protein
VEIHTGVLGGMTHLKTSNSSRHKRNNLIRTRVKDSNLLIKSSQMMAIMVKIVDILANRIVMLHSSNIIKELHSNNMSKGLLNNSMNNNSNSIVAEMILHHL